MVNKYGDFGTKQMMSKEYNLVHVYQGCNGMEAHYAVEWDGSNGWKAKQRCTDYTNAWFAVPKNKEITLHGDASCGKHKKLLVNYSAKQTLFSTHVSGGTLCWEFKDQKYT